MDSRRSLQGLDLCCHRRGRCLLIFILLALPLSATTYYVDNCVTVGNDSNNGTSPSTPWLTFAHANTQTYNPGDIVLLQGGCTWRETLSLYYGSAGGSAGHPITIQSYGTGQAIINGSALLNSGWSNGRSNVWNTALTTQPTWVFFNGTLGTMVGSTGAVTAPNYWYWAGNVLYVYSTSNPATAFTSPGVEATQRQGVNQTINGYLVFNNLNVQKTQGYAFSLYQLSNSIVANSTISYAAGRGISFYGGTCAGFSIFGNTMSYIGDDGIGIGACSNSAGTIYGNDISHCGMVVDDRSCISVNGESGTVGGVSIYNNKIHDSTEQTGPVGIRGIILDKLAGTGGGPNYVHHNLVYNCNGHGIESLLSTGQQIYYNIVVNNPNGGNSNINGITSAGGSANLIYGNTLYNNAFSCIYLSNDTSDAIKNNICLLTGSQTGIWVDTTTSGLALDYNLIYGASSLYDILGTAYSTKAALYSGKGLGQHDVNADPKLNSPTTGDFTLQSGSPAIDAGANLGSTSQMGLNPSSSWPSSVTTLNQNSYGSAWEIGAFVFVQQIRPTAPTALSVTVN